MAAGARWPPGASVRTSGDMEEGETWGEQELLCRRGDMGGVIKSFNSSRGENLGIYNKYLAASLPNKARYIRYHLLIIPYGYKFSWSNDFEKVYTQKAKIMAHTVISGKSQKFEVLLWSREMNKIELGMYARHR